MAQFSTLHKVSTIVAAENSSMLVPRLYKPDGTRYGVLYFPPKGQTADDVRSDYVARALAEAFPLLSLDLGNPTGSTPQWGNDAAMTKASAGWAFLTGSMGARSDGVLLYGGSMGGLSALNWAKRNTGVVRACAAVIPVMNLPYAHDNNVQTSTAGIETAYGGAGTYAANVVGHSPSELAAQMSGVSVKIWYSDADSDVFTPTHFYTDFAAACPTATLVDQGAIGHVVGVNAQDVVSFLLAHA